MPVIILHTVIAAPQERVFDLSRSIALHTLSTSRTDEQAIAGKTSGLMNLHDTVTWRARHLGRYRTLTSSITAYNFPHSFTDEMVEGDFHSFCHVHRFEARGTDTLMTDEFTYRSPYGWLGRLADVLFLKRYMRRFLVERNEVIREVAEGDGWKELL